MATPTECMLMASSALNDTAQETYDSTALLPYFNMALRDLLLRMEEAGMPTIQKVSTDLSIVAGTTIVSFSTSPALPSDLIEIDQIWESNDGGLSWTPLQRKDYIDPNIAENQQLSVFGCYAWNEDHIQLPEATADITLRLFYIRRISDDVDASSADTDIAIINCKQYLGFKTAAYAAMLIAQDPERASVCESQAEKAIEIQMNIPAKAQQAIVTRRRPFRAGYKNYGRSW